jgi:DNA-binding MarR family transcriptional regulator
MVTTSADSIEETAAALRVALSLLVRRFRHVSPAGHRDLTLPQRAALARLDHHGPMAAADLARLEQISPQSMGATLASLESAGLVARRPHPSDGRRIVMSMTAAGKRTLHERRTARAKQLAAAVAAEFSADELATLAAAAPLLERLGQRL